jgi:glycosyltransferase involved in cell wall biosynthesis
VSQPKVTVICIFYNAERFFAEAIRSVMAQDFADFELLLVDDGSTDGSTALALSHAMRSPGRITYLEHPGHARRGMSAARNLGLGHARGNFIAFIDADDRWRPGKLREQVAIMEAHGEIGMVAGAVNQWCSWDGGEDVLVPTGHMLDAIAPAPEAALAIYPLGKAAPPCPSDVMIRRSVLEQVGRFEASFTGPFEDSACFGKLLLAAPVYFSRRVWADRRIHDGSCTATTWREGQYPAMRAAFLRWYVDYLKGCDAPRRKAVLGAVRRTRWRHFLSLALRRNLNGTRRIHP